MDDVWEDVFRVNLEDDLIYSTHISVSCGSQSWWYISCPSGHRISCRLGRWCAMYWVLYRLPDSRSDFALCDRGRLISWRQSLLLWGPRRSIMETTFLLPFPSTGFVCDVLSITQNGPAVFGNRFDRDSWDIRPHLVLAINGRWT